MPVLWCSVFFMITNCTKGDKQVCGWYIKKICSKSYLSSHPNYLYHVWLLLNWTYSFQFEDNINHMIIIINKCSIRLKARSALFILIYIVVFMNNLLVCSLNRYTGNYVHLTHVGIVDLPSSILNSWTSYQYSNCFLIW